MPRPNSIVLSVVALAVLATSGAAYTATTRDEIPPAATEPTTGRQAMTMPTATEPPDTDISGARRLEADALNGTGLRVPRGSKIVRVRRERHDDRDVIVIRHQRDGYRLSGPHTSLVLDADGTILGFTRLQDGDQGPLPHARRAEEIALRFLRQVAPDHAEGLTVNWVAQHDETVTRPDGTTVTVTGMKVKTHHDNGLYTWVIVGPDETVLTYERDITWDSGRGRRGTQMWLHDSWIAAYEGAGPQPASPYALAAS
ncbi:hypothetical protein ABZ897_53610 [Nonomuraea sp. NPDC046802]|uniref:hypothetical protein n=1 Tax=Nonomuraea sp. NPDC046802 TaxID=3154919 RepID=UPI0033F5258B